MPLNLTVSPDEPKRQSVPSAGPRELLMAFDADGQVWPVRSTVVRGLDEIGQFSQQFATAEHGEHDWHGR